MYTCMDISTCAYVWGLPWNETVSIINKAELIYFSSKCVQIPSTFHFHWQFQSHHLSFRDILVYIRYSRNLIIYRILFDQTFDNSNNTEKICKCSNGCFLAKAIVRIIISHIIRMIKYSVKWYSNNRFLLHYVLIVFFIFR